MALRPAGNCCTPNSTKAFQPATVPRSAFSGPKTSPNGHAAKFVRSSASGWKLYGSFHGARARAS